MDERVRQLEARFSEVTFKVFTIAEQLGRTPHLSSLLRKVRKLGFADPEALRKLAVIRGCDHYRRPDDNLGAINDPGERTLPDVELAFAMLTASQTFDPRAIRAAVQLLSGADMSPRDIVRLAIWERCESLIRNVAEAAERFDEGNRAFWREISSALKEAPEVPEGRLPHPSRYYLESGFTRGKGESGARRIWLRPRRSMA